VLETQSFYIGAHEAAKILRQREEVKPLLNDYFLSVGGRSLPDITRFNKPFGVFFRHAPAFRMEDAVFYRLAEASGLVPYFGSYIDDTFVSLSSYKRSLIKHHVFCGVGRSGGPKTEKRVLQTMPRCQGQQLGKIMCQDRSRPLVRFHEHERNQHLSGHAAFFADYSDWFSDFGRAKDYYTAYLAMFVAHGVLFEDYHGGESGAVLDRFTAEVFEPSFKEVEALFGLTPLIVPMPRWHSWQGFYPAEGFNWYDAVPAVMHDQDRSMIL